MSIENSLDESLIYRLKALTKIADRLSSEYAREKIGVAYPEALVIGMVGMFGPQTVMDIARRANLDKSQASRTVEPLLSKGILSSVNNDDDGRSVIISLTAEGRKLFKKIGPALARRDNEFFSSLSEPESEALRYLLDKLLAAHGWVAKPRVEEEG